MASQRDNSLDLLRTVLILMGLVLHCAALFRTNGWLVSAQEQNLLLNSVNEFIHLFRMPALFTVAGLSLAILSASKKKEPWLKQRTVRLVVPFIVTSLTCNLLIVALSSNCGAGEACGRHPWEADGIQHLWFLSDLLIMTLFVCLCARAKISRQLLAALAQRPLKSVVLAVVLGTWFLQSVGIVLPWRYERLLLGSSFVTFTTYFAFLLGGIILGTEVVRVALVKLLTKRNALAWSLGVLLCSLPIPWLAGQLALPWQLYAKSLGAWTMIFAILTVVLHVQNYLSERQKKQANALADLSYSIYLNHTLCIVVAAKVILPLALPGFAAFRLILAISTCMSIALADWTHKTRVMRFLTEGALPTKTASKA